MTRSECTRATKEVIKYLDFNAVQKIMTHLNWQWMVGVEMEVPSIKEMHRVVKDLIQTAFDSKEGEKRVSAGGFEVFLSEETVSVRFIIEDIEISKDGRIL